MTQDQTTAVPLPSPLPHLGLVLVPPSPFLAPYVHSYWFIRRSWARPCIEEYLYPEGGLGLIFNLGDPLVINGTAVSHSSFLDGTNSVGTRLTFPQHVTAVGIRFHPGGAYPFLPLPLKEVQNQPLPLEQIMSPTVSSWSEQLASLPSLPQKITHLEQLLYRLQNPKRTLSPAVYQALTAVNRTKGQISIPSLAERCFIGQRQLERLFQTQVGMSAKTYARLMRVQRARAVLKQEQNLSAAHSSQELGFYDQSHFIREFQAIMRITPQQYRQKRALRQQQQGQV